MARSKKEYIQAIDLATEIMYDFPPTYRFARDVGEKLFAPPYFTDDVSITHYETLEKAKDGEIVFIEWATDKFCVYDNEKDDYVHGSRVWRKSIITKAGRLASVEEVIND